MVLAGVMSDPVNRLGIGEIYDLHRLSHLQDKGSVTCAARPVRDLLGERRRLQQQAGGRSEPRVTVEAVDAEIARLEKELGVDNTGRGSGTGDG